MHLRRIAMTLAFMVSMGVMLAAGAQAPTKEPGPPFPDMTGQYCTAFPVLLHAITNKDSIITFSNGRIHIAGHIVLTATNVLTGKTIIVNATGPAAITADGTTIRLQGRTLLFGEAGFFGPGSPPELSALEGLTIVDLTTGTILQRARNSTDLCPLLA
jgi:hypothetical protein